jgi:hypothetical protein
MPLQRCTKNGKPGTKYGAKGKCYTDVNPKVRKKKAIQQGLAIAQQQGRKPHL